MEGGPEERVVLHKVLRVRTPASSAPPLLCPGYQSKMLTLGGGLNFFRDDVVFVYENNFVGFRGHRR